jgi:adenine-specific DNA-methyltransferase
LSAVIDLVPPRVAGVVYTKPWMVELILDLAGYLPERPLARLVALEPSAGDGAFLQGMVRRLIESCRLHGIPVEQAAQAIGAFEIDPAAAEKAVALVCATARLLLRIGFFAGSDVA